MLSLKKYLPFALLLCAACHTAKKTTKIVEYRSLGPVSVSANNNPNDIYRATSLKEWEIEKTDVRLSFDMPAKTANGKALVTLYPYSAVPDSLILDAKGMRIAGVSIYNNEAATPVQYKYDGKQLHLKTPAYITGQQRLKVFVEYTATPYADSVSGGSAAITDDRGLYFINTNHEIPNKPVQIWTQGETESNSHWFPTIDKPNQRTTTHIELTVPDSFKTLSNGEMLSSKAAGAGLRTDVWEMNKPIQVYAVMFAAGNFSIIKDSWNGKEVNYYVEPEYAPYASLMFRHTPEMISWFSDITGVPYPWNKYDQVVVRDYVSGAMENTTASLFGEFMNQDAREIADRNYEDIVSHELFHQWFGDYATCESWSNLTVNESFANYSEQLWRRHYYGDVEGDKLAYDDARKYLDQADEHDEPLVRFHYGDKEQMFDRISYEKGGAVLNYLNGLMGDTLFHKAMHIYLTENAYQSTEATNWRLAIEKATGKDWNWFFNEYYYRGGHPTLTINYNYSDSTQQLKVTVRQTPKPDSTQLYILPLESDVCYGAQKTTVQWNITHRTETYTYPYRNGVRPLVVADARHWLVGDLKEDKTAAQWLQQFNSTTDYISKRRAIAAAYYNQGDTASKATLHAGLHDKMPQIVAYTITILNYIGDKKGWKEGYSDEVASLAMNSGDHMVRSAAFMLAGKWKITSLKPEMLTAIHDSSYMVAGAALSALAEVDSAQAYTLAKTILQQHPRGSLENEAWSAIVSLGKPEDITGFEATQNNYLGNDKISFANNMLQYAVATKDDAIFERTLQILTHITITDESKSNRQGVGMYTFGLLDYYRGVAAGHRGEGNKTEAIRRLPITEKYARQILAAETDPDNKREYQEALDAKVEKEK